MGLSCSELSQQDGRLQDDADATGHHFSATSEEGSLVGTARSNFLRDGVPTPFDKLVMGLGGEVPDAAVLSVTSRLVVCASHRRSTLAARLAVAVYQHGLEHGIYYDAIFVQPPLVPTYLRMGYRTTSVSKLSHPQGVVVPLLLTGRDWDYLESIGSIFRRAPSFRQL
jgi:GNAT superfamily N-acetyltransferase